MMLWLVILLFPVVSVPSVYADSISCPKKPASYFIDYKRLKEDDLFKECLIYLHGESTLRNIVADGITKLNEFAYELSLDMSYTHPNLIDSKIKYTLITAMRDDSVGVLSAFKDSPFIFIPCGLSEELTYHLSISSINERQEKLNLIIWDEKQYKDIIHSAKICSYFLFYSLFKIQNNKNNNQY